MVFYTCSLNIGEKLCTFALSPIVVENHRVECRRPEKYEEHDHKSNPGSSTTAAAATTSELTNTHPETCHLRLLIQILQFLANVDFVSSY